MIELPEVETIRRDLDKEVVGKRIKTVEVKIARAVGGSANKAKIKKRLEKSKIVAVYRRGLHLLMELDTEETVVFDLGESGQLVRTQNKTEVHKRTAVIIGFTQHGQLRLIDMGTDATMMIHPNDELEDAYPQWSELGIDPIEEPIAWLVFGEMLRRYDMKLKTLLMDDTIVLGIGPMYADEILFGAGLRYDRLANQLTTQEVRRLYRALVETLHDAMKYRGSSVEGSEYVDLFGEPGSYQDHHSVYMKHGQLSPRSRRPIARSKFGGIWTYYCEQSQV